jgi:hypothetical protein
MDFTFAKQLHYLIHHVDGEYVAHCLDMDLIGSGDTKENAVQQLNTAVRALVFFALRTDNFDIGRLCGRAPEDYWGKFDEAKRTSGTTTRTLDILPEVAPVTVKQCHFTYCLAVAA